MAEQVVINFVGNDQLTPVIKDVNKQSEDLDKNLKEVSKAADSGSKAFSAMGEIGIGALRSLGEGALGIASSIGSSLVGGIGEFFSSAIQGSADYQNVLAQTRAVIESTGGAAGFTVEQMEGMARSMSAAEGMSLFPDDAILSAQNVLATFTKIEGVQFEGATQAALDMAQALGMDLSGAAMMMGKALNDPVKGMSALSRSGVSFTDQQKAMVEEMVAVGDVAGAQQLILKEMEVQFGGSALAATETFEGSMTLLSEAFEDAKGSIGDALLPVLTGFANITMTYVLPVVKEAFAAFGEWISGLDWIGITTSISGLIQTLVGFVSGIDWAGLFAALSSFGSFLMSQLPTAMTIVSPLIDNLKQSFTIFFGVLTGPAVQTIIANIVQFGAVVAGVLAGLLNNIAPAITGMQGVFQSLVGVLATVTTAIMETLTSPAVMGAINVLSETFGILASIIVELARIAIDVLGFAFTLVWPIIDGVIKDIGNVIGTVFPVINVILNGLLSLLKGDFTTVWGSIKTTISTAWTNIQTAVQTGIDGVKTKLTELISSAVDFGRDLAGGIAKGISNGASAIANAAKDAAANALQAAKDFLGIASPSKVFAEDVGLPISQGVAAGILRGASDIANAVNYSTGSAASVTNSTVQNYYLTANYATVQSESSLRNDLRGLQLLSGAL